MKQLDTVFMPGAILMICRPGRSVAAVVQIAPATMPSTLSSYSIIAPKNMVSFMVASAFSGVMPLALRIS